MAKSEKKASEVNVQELSKDVGGVEDLSAKEKSQVKMTYWVLGGSVLLLGISAFANIYNFDPKPLASIQQEISDFCANQHSPDSINFCSELSAMASASYKNSAAKDFFEFCKNFIPPIITLVLGAHYVNKNNSNDT